MTGIQPEIVRIAITGAHSVGKTTLAGALNTALAKAGVRTVTAEEPIRKLAGELASLPPLSRYLRLTTEHLSRLAAPGADCCIYDRCLLDLLVHLRLEGPDNPELKAMILELLKWYRHWFDLFLYLPIEFPLVPDDRRPPAEEYRRLVDLTISQVAAETGIALVPITGALPTRIDLSLQLVKALLEKKQTTDADMKSAEQYA